MKKSLIIVSIGIVITSLLLLSNAMAIKTISIEKNFTDVKNETMSLNDEIYCKNSCGSFVDESIYLKPAMVPLLKLASIQEDSKKYKKFYSCIINHITSKGYANAKDIKNILADLNMTNVNAASGTVSGSAHIWDEDGDTRCVERSFPSILIPGSYNGGRFWRGSGLIVNWRASYCSDKIYNKIDITICGKHLYHDRNSTPGTNINHKGRAFLFYGYVGCSWGHGLWEYGQDYADCYLELDFNSNFITWEYTDPNIGNQPPIINSITITPNPARLGETVNFNCDVTDPDGYVVTYGWRSDKDGFLSSEQSFSTSTLSIGVHIITLKVTDDDGDSTSASGELQIILPNYPPEITYLDGNEKGAQREDYELTVRAEDENGDDVYYKIDWGDGTDYDFWIGRYPCGQEQTFTHIYYEQDSYTIRVKAKDEHDLECKDWTTLPIQIS